MKLITKKGATFAFALALTIPAVTPVAAASNEKVSIDSIQFNGMNPPSTIDQMMNTYTNASVEIKVQRWQSSKVSACL